MKIELATSKRIAKAVPELTIAQFVAIWAEKIEDRRRETEAARIAEKRAIPPTSVNIGANIEPTSCNTEQRQPTREEQERVLFNEARAVCGKQAGGMVSVLLKQHGYNLEAVKHIFAAARTKADPRAYVAAAIRRPNGTGNDTMAAFDRLIASTADDEGEANPPMRDITP